MIIKLGRGRGFYGFRQDHNNNNDEEQIEILRDAIFIQNLPKNITRNDIYDVFSTVGAIKVKNSLIFLFFFNQQSFLSRRINGQVVRKFGFIKIV